MELEILHWFASLHNPVLDTIMYGFTLLGEAGIFWIIIAALMLIGLPKKDYRKVGLTIAIALVLSLIMCNGIMKNVFQRTRPFVADPTLYDTQLYNIFDSITDWSFPSGHTSASFAAAVAIFMWKKKEGIAAFVVAAMISISRLYLTVHYPSDVAASLVLGSLYGVIAFFVVKWILAKVSRKNSESKVGE
ncbi:MAG: phosphatase PAP2 family protein [Lachnospira sp.]